MPESCGDNQAVSHHLSTELSFMTDGIAVDMLADAVQLQQQQQHEHRYDQQGTARGQIGSSLSAYICTVPS